LYAFWGETLLAAINDELAAMPRPVVVNLASEEYFKAAVGRKIAGTVIQPVFEDWKNGKYKIISFYAKRARGLMTRYAVLNRLREPEGLKDFDLRWLRPCAGSFRRDDLGFPPAAGLTVRARRGRCRRAAVRRSRRAAAGCRGRCCRS
jgi:hypothetical protein